MLSDSDFPLYKRLQVRYHESVRKKMKLFKDQARSKTGYLLYITFGLILLAFAFVFLQNRLYSPVNRYSAPLATPVINENVESPSEIPDEAAAQLVLVSFLETVIQAGPPSSNPTSAREAVGFLTQANQASFPEDDTAIFPELLAFMQIAESPQLGFRLDAFEIISENTMVGTVTVNRGGPAELRKVTLLKESGEWKVQSAEVLSQ